MIALLAQAEGTTPLQIPVSYGGIAAITIGGVVVVLLIAVWLLKEFQSARTALVAEVKREMAAPVEPTPMSLPQPFTVQPHVEFTPLSDHEALEERVQRHEESTAEGFKDMALASSASREKIYNLVRAEAASTRSEFNGKIDGLTKSINDTLVALGRAEGELRANRAKQNSG